MISKYLSDLGIKEEDVPENWNPDDDRQEFWKKQREEYGFDERETWNLDYSFVLWFYTRLKMYNKINCVNTSYHTIEYNNEVLTFQECIDRMLLGFETYLTKDIWSCSEKDEVLIHQAFELIPKTIYLLWW